MMMEAERRRTERLMLRPPLAGRIGDHQVELHEIGPLGGRVEHHLPLAGPAPVTLKVDWDGEEIIVDCSVAHSETIEVSGRFSSGLAFELAPANGGVRRIVEALSAREQIERLKKIVEASKLINSSIEADALFGTILHVALEELGVERGTLYFVDEQRKEIWSKVAGGLDGVQEIRLPVGKGLAGTVAATGEAIVLHDAYGDPRFDRSHDQKTGYRTRSMLCVPINNRERRVVGVLQLLNKKQGSFGQRDLEFLDAISEHMAIAMENATLHMDLIEKNRMERELQLGREIQSRLFPKPPSDVSGIQLDARSVPCFEVGGDYYDFIELPNGDLGIAVGDVSGKGVAAALIMSSLQAALRVAAPLEPSLSSLIARLNGLIYRMAGGRKYVTFFFGRYTPATGELRYVNAGHNPPFVIVGGQMESIDSTGRPIGILPNASYEERTIVLPKGATLFLYTDGLNEAANEEEEELGMPRLRELATEASAGDLFAISEYVLQEVTAFENGTHATDDKTVVVLRRA
jgi:sigma-B regulation protein RsbU (phosphoserine phosphatase)